MYTLEQIAELSNEEFYDAFINGELNSMDLPAREYFERKDLIAEQITKREILKQLDDGQSYVHNFVRAEDKTDEFMIPRYAIAVAESEASALMVTFIESEEERDRILEVFQNTGELDFFNYVQGQHINKSVHALLEIDIKSIFVSKEFRHQFTKE